VDGDDGSPVSVVDAVGIASRDFGWYFEFEGIMPPFCDTFQYTGKETVWGKKPDPFEELYNWLARESPGPFEPVLYSLHTPMHRLVLLAEAQTGFIYPEELYGLRIPAFSEVYSDEVEDAVVSVAVQ
jgi:hypothetical protein